MMREWAREERSGGRGTAKARRRKRWRLRPSLLALEDRVLLSTIVVNNPTDTPVAGKTDLRQAIVQANTKGGPRRSSLTKWCSRRRRRSLSTQPSASSS